MVNNWFMFMGGVIGLLNGIGLLIFAFHLAFRHPEEMKRHPRLRHIKDHDWVQHLAGGFFFSAWSIFFLIWAMGEPDREVSDLESGFMRGLFIASVVALAALLCAKVVDKFHK